MVHNMQCMKAHVQMNIALYLFGDQQHFMVLMQTLNCMVGFGHMNKYTVVFQ